MNTKTWTTFLLTFFCHSLTAQLIDFQGPYPWPPNIPNSQIPSDAIANSDSRIIAWATQVTNYSPGSNVSAIWMNTSQALGAAEGAVDSIVSLGANGSITLSFATPITNGSGTDFVVFENSFDDFFLELAWVEVSSDGVHFSRFPASSQWNFPTSSFGQIDPTYIDGFAGKYTRGYGVPFDLSDLPQNTNVNPNNISFVRIVDIFGNGSQLDSNGNGIYDPTPTTISGGFDLDGVGVINELQEYTYAQWVTEQSFNTNQNGEQQDPDQDGSSNLLEYWFGSNPLSNTDRPNFSLTRINDTSFEVSYPTISNQSSLSLQVQLSNDLVIWTPIENLPILSSSTSTLDVNRTLNIARYTTDQNSNFIQFILTN